MIIHTTAGSSLTAEWRRGRPHGLTLRALPTGVNYVSVYVFPDELDATLSTSAASAAPPVRILSTAELLYSTILMTSIDIIRETLVGTRFTFHDHDSTVSCFHDVHIFRFILYKCTHTVDCIREFSNPHTCVINSQASSTPL
jgi:hypothetical protein